MSSFCGSQRFCYYRRFGSFVIKRKVCTATPWNVFITSGKFHSWKWYVNKTMNTQHLYCTTCTQWCSYYAEKLSFNTSILHDTACIPKTSARVYVRFLKKPTILKPQRTERSVNTTTKLYAWRLGGSTPNRFREVSFLGRVETGFQAHSVPHTTATSALSQGKLRRKAIIHLQSVSRLKRPGDIPPFFHLCSWRCARQNRGNSNLYLRQREEKVLLFSVTILTLYW